MGWRVAYTISRQFNIIICTFWGHSSQPWIKLFQWRCFQGISLVFVERRYIFLSESELIFVRSHEPFIWWSRESKGRVNHGLLNFLHGGFFWFIQWGDRFFATQRIFGNIDDIATDTFTERVLGLSGVKVDVNCVKSFFSVWYLFGALFQLFIMQFFKLHRRHWVNNAVETERRFLLLNWSFWFQLLFSFLLLFRLLCLLILLKLW